jgi:protease IV
MVFALILAFLLVLSVGYNLLSSASTLVPGKARMAHSAGPRLEEVVAEDNDAVNKIVVLGVEGIITSRVIDQTGYNLAEVIKAQLKRAQEDPHVKAVILKVDSPGGEVLASDDIYRTLAEFQEQSGKPVVASMGNLAASGGYYVSAPCQWIVANELTLTGSIGVIMHSWNYRGLMDKVGVRPEVYKSGKFKDMLSGDRNPNEIPAEEREMLQALIDETFAKFKKVVGDGRKRSHDKNKDRKEKGRPLAQDWASYADGRVLSGSEAWRLGFVDELGDFEQAKKRAQVLAGIASANLIEYQQRFDLSDFLRLFGKTENRTMKLDLGAEIPKLQVGQLYFLSPTFAH